MPQPTCSGSVAGVFWGRFFWPRDFCPGVIRKEWC